MNEKERHMGKKPKQVGGVQAKSHTLPALRGKPLVPRPNSFWSIPKSLSKMVRGETCRKVASGSLDLLAKRQRPKEKKRVRKGAHRKGASRQRRIQLKGCGTRKGRSGNGEKWPRRKLKPTGKKRASKFVG